ncbi:MAG: 50S ribosomal protein L23 [Fimbriimonadales bacterium]
MKNPYSIILNPVLTEKSVAHSQENKYVFFVHPDANKIEIAEAIEAIYNSGKKKEKDQIQVTKVNVINVTGKMRRVGMKSRGKRPDRRKAIVTLGEGQVLEGFGV